MMSQRNIMDSKSSVLRNLRLSVEEYEDLFFEDERLLDLALKRLSDNKRVAHPYRYLKSIIDQEKLNSSKWACRSFVDGVSPEFIHGFAKSRSASNSIVAREAPKDNGVSHRKALFEKLIYCVGEDSERAKDLLSKHNEMEKSIKTMSSLLKPHNLLPNNDGYTHAEIQRLSSYLSILELWLTDQKNTYNPMHSLTKKIYEDNKKELLSLNPSSLRATPRHSNIHQNQLGEDIDKHPVT
jgi:hypothetical protein